MGIGHSRRCFNLLLRSLRIAIANILTDSIIELERSFRKAVSRTKATRRSCGTHFAHLPVLVLALHIQ
jgi:hypothetical protein